jgi:DNA-binding CsgD family transcriptional regulator
MHRPEVKTLEQACQLLPTLLDEIRQWQHLSQLETMLLRIAEMFGCTHGHFSIRRSLVPVDPGVRRFTTYPLEKANHYIKMGAWAFDPVYVHMSQSAAPICNSEADWSDPRAATLLAWLTAEGFGPSGLSMSVHGRNGLTAMLRLMSTEKAPCWAEWREEAKSLIASLSTHLFEVVSALCRDSDFVVVAISPREAECLEWSARGKTIVETAMILGLSQSTVRHLLDSARLKLGAATKSQAVARAKELHLVSA